ncbi:hypothetical protein [Sphingobacterium bovistauri]|uniref:Uncharacterized protein n=1 Tax=Sphingobacterium bovistauri TaxID=2781959 RepID=A0ABS7Z8K9_9SPHI|nr:hypothetical protein [Sphingobacterium bovistauri]MCA5006333.1 hypothetical protein [Sphingobacterium bovistauri]
MIRNRENVKVLLWNESFSELYTTDDNVEFRLNKVCVSAFNHELCHLCINQVFGGVFPDLYIRMPYELKEFLPRDCVQHISNCIEHKLFYNLYLEIGGMKDRFIVDYELVKGNNFHKKVTKLNLNNLHLYLGNLYSIIGDCNDRIDYKRVLTDYRKLNPKIFDSCNLLLEEIKSLGINEPAEEFIITDEGIIINKTIGSLSESFWTVVFDEFNN